MTKDDKLAISKELELICQKDQQVLSHVAKQGTLFERYHPKLKNS